MLVLSGFVCDYSFGPGRPQMGLIAGIPLITIILASMLCGPVLRQLMRTKKSQRSPVAMLSVEDVQPGYEYEVFLSFRGVDTRSTFTDCLYHRLRHAGVHVFQDNEQLRVGEEIGGELLKALNKSQIYIPIFSRGYATSSWCLCEVAHMVEGISKSKGKKEILPIFFDVDPDDVKLKTKLYKRAIAKHKKKFGSDALKRWEDALVKVAHLKGWELKEKGYGQLIESVVQEVLGKLSARNVDVPEYWVEDHCQIEEILEKLEVDSDGVRFLGIHGIDGIGKTVLAKVVFNKVSSHFDGVCFLDNIRESLQDAKSLQQGLIKLQKKLLESFGGLAIVDHIKDIGDGMNRIKRVCHTKKVLIVLDDLDKPKQLKKLAGKSDWFGSGSRIIFTTRNLDVLKTQVESSNEEVLNQPKGILAYEVLGMEFGQALQLFCKHAFRRDSPLKGYDHLAKKIVHRVGMLPSAIEGIGSFLYCPHIALEEHYDNIKLWEDTLKQLDDGPFKNVRDALMISYEGLEDNQKEVFLDIACFFTNENKSHPVIMWDDCNCHPYGAINVLCQQSLIKIGRYNEFQMHDQVRDLGRHIVLKEYPRNISRVWLHEDAVNLLKRKERNEDVKALSLTPYECSCSCSCNIVPEELASGGCHHKIVLEELAALPNLRFLRVQGIGFFGNFENIVSKLCWLSWEVTHNKFYAENLHFASLVVLDLSYSDIKDDWGGWSQFQLTKKLKVLDLTECIYLTRTPDFSNFLSLEFLLLTWCENLITIDRSIGKLEHLKILDVAGCKSLWALPPELASSCCYHKIVPEDLAALPNLGFFRVQGIGFFGNFENIVSKLCWLSWEVTHNKFYAENLHFASLVVLDLSYSDIKDDWGGWSQFQMTKKLKVLDLTECIYLTRTPDFSNFLSLEILLLTWCENLITIDRSIGKLEHLKILDVGGCKSLRMLPQEVGSLPHLMPIVENRHIIERIQRERHSRILPKVLVAGVWANLTRLSLHGCGETKALLERLDSLNFRPDIIIEVYP